MESLDVLNGKTNILREIEEFYKEKETKSHLVIKENIKALELRYDEDSIPNYTNSTLNLISEPEVTESLKIPSPIQIGFLNPKCSYEDIKFSCFVDYIKGRGICIELNDRNEKEAHQFLQNLGLKVLLSISPSAISTIVIDPDGSGANFKLLLGYEKAKPNLILHKSEIGTKLSEVLKSFNKLQTENLTFKYDNLEELNLNEPKLAKPYTFIFISNYPSGFKKEDQEILESITAKGQKFGTFVFMSYNPSVKPDWDKDKTVETFIEKIALLRQSLNGYEIANCEESKIYNPDYSIELEGQYPSTALDLISFLNKAAKENSSKAVSQSEYLEKVLSGDIEIWRKYCNEDDKNIGVKVPIGLKSATEELEFTFDCNTDNYHAIVGGKTGSGKTVLLDNIIVNAAIQYPPQELQFVLLDFKGASFQKYKNLPHLKILFGGNDRNYGLNVLRFLDYENSRRQTVLANYGGNINALTRSERFTHNLPRLIIILDEFQVLLKEIDAVTREANRHIDTIAQQGRSAGIHLILSSQDLTGITISDSAQFNANVRIALQMDPNACKQIFSMDNIEASLLEKKGEAIYNEKPGRPKYGNQRFQVYKLDDSLSKRLVQFLNEKYSLSSGKKVDRYFLPNENNASLTNNQELLNQLSTANKRVLYPRIYFGEPAFIRVNKKTLQKEDSYLLFRRAENSNLLLAGNDMGAASIILGLTLLQLLRHDSNTRVHLVNSFGADKSEWRERFKLIESTFSDRFKYYQKNEAANALSSAEEEISLRRTSEENCSFNYYLVILNLDQSFQKQGFTVTDPAKKLINILKQGPDLGLHTIIYSYSSKSVTNSGIEADLFESKVVLKGDSKDIVKIGEYKEPSKEKMIYLHAPSPITSVNPDLVNVYSVYDYDVLQQTIQETFLIEELLKDFGSDE